MLLNNAMLQPCYYNVTAQCYCTTPCYGPVTTMLLHNALHPEMTAQSSVTLGWTLHTATVHLRRVYLPPTPTPTYHLLTFTASLSLSPSENQQGRKIKLQIKIFVSDKIRFYIRKLLHPENPSNNYEEYILWQHVSNHETFKITRFFPSPKT